MYLCAESRSNQLTDGFPCFFLELRVHSIHYPFISEGFHQAKSFRKGWEATFCEGGQIDVAPGLFLGF